MHELSINVLEKTWPAKASIGTLLYFAGLDPVNYPISGESSRELWGNLLPILESRGELAKVLRAVEPNVGESFRTLAGTLITLVEDRSRDDAAVRDRARVMAELESVWTQLRQAHDHQMALMMPSHPNPARIAGMRSWIRGCVKGISKAQRSGAQTVRSEEIAQVEEIAASLATVVDAFQIYADLLDRFRNSDEPEPRLSPQQRPLTVVAEDQRLLVSYRAALRKSMQQLISVLQTDN